MFIEMDDPNTTIERKTASSFKFTLTAKNELRLKVPKDCLDKDMNWWLGVGVRIARNIGPVDYTLRGNILNINSTTINLHNDSKTINLLYSLVYHRVVHIDKIKD